MWSCRLKFCHVALAVSVNGVPDSACAESRARSRRKALCVAYMTVKSIVPVSVSAMGPVLSVFDRHGPLSPSALARLAGLHPATMTGVLDRLERGGWVVRERDPADRRAVTLRTLRDRRAELLGLYSGMNNAVRRICADYGETELTLVAGFLERIAAAGRASNEDLFTAGQSQSG